jgi:hypothetical protein
MRTTLSISDELLIDLTSNRALSEALDAVRVRAPPPSDGSLIATARSASP